MRIALDFDGVLWDAKEQDWLPGARGLLQSLIRDRHDVVIFSCRGNWPEGRASIRAALDVRGFRRVKIFEGVKPEADCYLDDKALRFIDVEQARLELRALAASGTRRN